MKRNVVPPFHRTTLDFADENGNGLADEAGFHIERNEDQLTIRLTVEIVNTRGEQLIKSGEAKIRIRN